MGSSHGTSGYLPSCLVLERTKLFDRLPKLFQESLMLIFAFNVRLWGNEIGNMELDCITSPEGSQISR